jgi:hypothetical protein
VARHEAHGTLNGRSRLAERNRVSWNSAVANASAPFWKENIMLNVDLFCGGLNTFSLANPLIQLFLAFIVGVLSALAVPEIRKCIEDGSHNLIERARCHLPASPPSEVPSGTIGKLGYSLLLTVDAKIFRLIRSVKALPTACAAQVSSVWNGRFYLRNRAKQNLIEFFLFASVISALFLLVLAWAQGGPVAGASLAVLELLVWRFFARYIRC